MKPSDDLNDLQVAKPLILPIPVEKRLTKIENARGVQNFEAYFKANLESIQDPETKAKEEEKQRQDRIRLNTQKIEQLKL